MTELLYLLLAYSHLNSRVSSILRSPGEEFQRERMLPQSMILLQRLLSPEPLRKLRQSKRRLSLSQKEEEEEPRKTGDSTSWRLRASAEKNLLGEKEDNNVAVIIKLHCSASIVNLLREKDENGVAYIMKPTTTLLCLHCQPPVGKGQIQCCSYHRTHTSLVLCLHGTPTEGKGQKQCCCYHRTHTTLVLCLNCQPPVGKGQKRCCSGIRISLLCLHRQPKDKEDENKDLLMSQPNH